MYNDDKGALMGVNFLLSMVAIAICIGRVVMFNNGIVDNSMGYSILIFFFFLIGCPIVGIIYD